MAKFLSQDQINEYKECFSLHDRNRRGKINAKDLLTVMRSLGCCVTPAELDRHLLTHQIDQSGELDFSTFLNIMHTQSAREDPRSEIQRAVRLTDVCRGGFITTPELRARLTRFGETLSNQEVDELLSGAGLAHDGRIRYEDCDKIVAFLTR